MKKMILIILFSTGFAFCQEKPKTIHNNTTIKDSVLYNKIEFDKKNPDKKSSPQQFFIINDKPVDLETYQKQNTVKKPIK